MSIGSKFRSLLKALQSRGLSSQFCFFLLLLILIFAALILVRLVPNEGCYRTGPIPSSDKDALFQEFQDTRQTLAQLQSVCNALSTEISGLKRSQQEYKNSLQLEVHLNFALLKLSDDASSLKDEIGNGIGVYKKMPGFKDQYAELVTVIEITEELIAKYQL